MKYRKLKPYINWSIFILIIGFLVKTLFFQKKETVIEFQTEIVRNEKLVQEVSATGTINPIELLEVGTQVSGIISHVYVDFNDKVKKGQVIATMDTKMLSANIKESQANLNKIKIPLEFSKTQLERIKELYKKEAVSLLELENAQNTFDNNQAQFDAAKAALERTKVNLAYSTIISPIDGIVISREVEVGQTVAASFSTPRLFTIANDMTKMKIEANVDEADIGQVKKGQTVTFTVDTYQDLEFTGIVEQVQLNPIITSNVVTYNVIVLFENPDLKLIPGMTATLLIKINESDQMNTVPNSAFTFQIDSTLKQTLLKKGFSIEEAASTEEKNIWIKNKKTIKQIQGEVLFTDGLRSGIKGDIKTLDTLITGIELGNGNKKGNILNRGNDE